MFTDLVFLMHFVTKVSFEEFLTVYIVAIFILTLVYCICSLHFSGTLYKLCKYVNCSCDMLFFPQQVTGGAKTLFLSKLLNLTTFLSISIKLIFCPC